MQPKYKKTKNKTKQKLKTSNNPKTQTIATEHHWLHRFIIYADQNHYTDPSVTHGYQWCQESGWHTSCESIKHTDPDFMPQSSVLCVRLTSLSVCWLLNVPTSWKAYLTMDLLRWLHVLPHWDRNCRSNLLSHPVTVYSHRTNQS